MDIGYLLIKLINHKYKIKIANFSYNIIIEYTKSADDEKIISL